MVVVEGMLRYEKTIVQDLIQLQETNQYDLKNIDLIFMKSNILQWIDMLENNHIETMDFNILKEIEDMIYLLNLNNNFSTLTDHISNEFYAFEFMSQEKLKKSGIVMSGKDKYGYQHEVRNIKTSM